MSCPAIDPKEAQDLKAKVESWIQSHGKEGVVVKLDSGKEGFKPIDTHHEGKPTKKLMFYYSCGNNTYISFGFKSEVQDGWTTDTAKQQFSHMALDKLPLGGLEQPANWNVYPQTGCSSFSEGVEWDLFDVKNKRVKFHVKTNAYCVRGIRNDLPPVGCGKSPDGSFFDVTQNVPITLSVDLPIQIG